MPEGERGGPAREVPQLGQDRRGGEGERHGLGSSLLPSFPPSLLPSRAKHVPERTCVACRGKFPQAALYRFRKTPAGWALEPGLHAGRSQYVCAKPECHLEKKLRRAFREQAPQVAAMLATQELP